MTDWGLIDPGGFDATGTDDDSVLIAMVEVERALLRAWGSVLDEFLDGHAGMLDAGALDRGVIRGGVARDGVPVVALVPALRAQLEAAALSTDRLHLGATSQDIVDTALMLISRHAFAAARNSLVETGRMLAALARSGRDEVRMARSLARHAEVSTFGVLAARWLDGVASAVGAIDAVEFPVQFGGAAGTGTAADAAAGGPDGADEVRAELARALGLVDPLRSWQAERTPVLAVAATAVAVIGALGRIAQDVTLLSREEIGEVRLTGGGGSSAMPHKRNPVAAVQITAAATEAPALLHVVATAAVAADERAAGRWHAEWPALRRLARLTTSSAGAAAALVGGLAFDPGRAAEIVADAGAAAAAPDRHVLAGASARIVDTAITRFTRITGEAPAA